jgi:hypothetical protein
MIPTTREEFKGFVLRNLGLPVLQSHLDDDQIEDRIDEALIMYMNFHYDASEKQYYKYLVTDTDITNQYITMPDNIMGVIKIFNYGDRFSNINNLFGVQYQLALNELFMFNSYSMVPYYMGMQQLELIDQLLVGEKPIRYNRKVNRLYIDWDWNLIAAGQYLMVECFNVIDPNTYAKIWQDQWLIDYSTALIKRAYGNVLKKYGGIQLLGGITFNGQQIYDEGQAEVLRLKDEMQRTWTPVLGFFIGYKTLLLNRQQFESTLAKGNYNKWKLLDQMISPTETETI